MKVVDLPVGSKVMFGKYAVSDEEPHTIPWIKVNENDSILVSEFIEDLLEFDSTEIEKPFGNARYSLSNINQFLNSTTEEHWFVPTHANDSPPTDVRHGFLHFFSESEIMHITPTHIYTREQDDNGDYKEVHMDPLVFIPESLNISPWLECKRLLFDYFKSGDTAASITTYAKRSHRVEYLPSKWFYWLRDSGDKYCTCMSDAEDGHLTHDIYPCTTVVGVRPALQLIPNAIVTDKPDSFGYYHVIIDNLFVEFDDDEFFNLIIK